jgi:hypothetical protein
MAQGGRSLKSGWLSFGNGFSLSRSLTALALSMISASAAAQITYARGQWAALQYDARCEARGRALKSPDRPPAYAGFAFGAVGRPAGQFYAKLGRAARPGSTVIVTVGDRPFLLRGQGDWAWSRDAGQQAAIIAAARYATGMRVETRDTSGRRSIDRYPLDGAATAIDAAAAACAQAGKKR